MLTELNIANRTPETVDVIVKGKGFYHHGGATFAQFVTTAGTLLFATDR